MNPAGWYTDPHDPTRMRWWDGVAWSEETTATHPPAEQWGMQRSVPLSYELPESPVQPSRNGRLGVLLLAVVVIGAAVIAVLVTRDGGGSDGGGGGAAAPTTVAAPGGANAGPDADLALIETCRSTRRAIMTALEAWNALGGSSDPADNHPESGYPMTLGLLATSDTQLLAEPPNDADWEYDPAVGPPSLRAKPGGSYNLSIVTVCNAG